jgi:hypothetical protein
MSLAARRGAAWVGVRREGVVRLKYICNTTVDVERAGLVDGQNS